LEILEELDKELITTMDKLFTKLRKLEDLIRLKKKELCLFQIQIKSENSNTDMRNKIKKYMK